MKRNSILLCLLFAIAANFIAPAAKAQVNTTDSLALVDLYNSTDGPGWKYSGNWLTTMPVSTWHDVRVINNRVTNLSLGNNNLHGTIPVSIGNLTNLAYLDMSSNLLSGTIPFSIGNLVKLTTLNLSGNTLSGKIPSSISKLVKLTTLNLSANALSGTIPSSFGKLIHLTYLALSENKLTGTIPANLGNLKSLIYLYLMYNHLTGAIPDTLGYLSNLYILDLFTNQLTGTIPLSLNQLQSTYISLESNRLTKFADGYPTKDTDNIHLNINRNLFTFNGLQVIAKYYINMLDADYAPQDTILPIHQHGSTLAVTAGGTLGNNTYKWYKAGAAGSTSIAADSTFTPTINGRYYVSVKDKGVPGLTLYSDTFNYVIPTAKQSNTLVAKATTPSIVTSHMQVYPNPATNIIHIQTNGTAAIILTNSNGKTLLTKTISNSDVINVSAFANGVYYIQNKITGEMQKIVIVH